LSVTSDLIKDHLFVRRLGVVIQRCSDKLYANEDVPLEDIEVASVIMEEFVDVFHHGKEEKAYFPVTEDKNSFSEDIRKFLIEHELGRRIARMLRRELVIWRKSVREGSSRYESKEPVARFLKSYAVFISDHTTKEDVFFDVIEDRKIISIEEDEMIKKYYEACKFESGGKTRIEELLRLLEYLENTQWMKDKLTD
jgi:hemerythrin-like domain-containing protein